MKNSRVYKSAMLILAFITAALLIMTVIHVKSETVFTGPFTAVLLALTALLTAVCICIDQPRGNRIYKCGFYILHGGLVILLCGFLISRFLGASYNLAFPVGGNAYSAVQNEDGSMVNLGFYIGVADAKTEYYTDEEGRLTENPKHYEATVTVADGKTAQTRTEKLTVNHPLRVHGERSYKIYLMSFGYHPATGEYSAYLLLKSDPAEYTILAGILLLLAGGVLMCLLAPVTGKKRKGRIHKSDSPSGTAEGEENRMNKTKSAKEKRRK